MAIRRSKSKIQGENVQMHKQLGPTNNAEATTDMSTSISYQGAGTGCGMLKRYGIAALQSDLKSSGEGLSSGYDRLDAHCRIPQRAITIIAGRPSHGKSTMLLNLALNFANANPDKTYYFFTYEDACQVLGIRAVMNLAGEILDHENNQDRYEAYIKGDNRNMPSINHAMDQYEDLSKRLIINDDRMSAQELCKTVEALSHEVDIGAIFIDYIQKVPFDHAKGKQEYAIIKEISRCFLNCAIDQGIPVIMGCQLGRPGSLQNYKPSEMDAVLRLDNMREAGDIEIDANLVLGLYLNPSSHELTVRILKNKRGPRDIDVSLKLEGAINRIVEYRRGTRKGW